MTEATAGSEKPLFGLGSLVNHPMFGTGRVVSYEGQSYVIIFKGGESKRVGFSFTQLTAVTLGGDPELDRIQIAMREVLSDFGWLDSEIEMGRRWIGGSILLKPGKEGTQEKEIPLDMLFKKIIGIREKLRVLEQKINNHPALSPADKLELEGYITRSYGSLTSFNMLFASKESQFQGTGKSEESASSADAG